MFWLVCIKRRKKNESQYCANKTVLFMREACILCGPKKNFLGCTWLYTGQGRSGGAGDPGGQDD